jgi:DNA-binding cell septation regulator SpoVG
MNTTISQVTFYPLRPTEKGLIGIAGCLFDNKLFLNSISIYLTPTGDIRLLFPNKILPNSKEINIFYPVNNETYEVLKQAVAKKIQELSKKAKGDYQNEQPRYTQRICK